MIADQILDPVDAHSGLRLELKNVTIGVVTALAKEFAAACHVLGCTYRVHVPGERTYNLGAIKHRDKGWHIVAVTQLPSMGNSVSAVRATKLIIDCPSIKDVIMCGIAGAVPSPFNSATHVRLGDIVVSNRQGVLQYDFKKEEGRKTQIRSTSLAPSPRICDADCVLASDECRDERSWERHLDNGIAMLGGKWARVPTTKDVLRDPPSDLVRRCAFGAGRLIAEIFGKELEYPIIKHPLDNERREGKPKVFRGLIASSNTLLKKHRVRNQLRDEHKALAVEMEASGVAEAAHDSSRGYFVVRGTVDYCNGQKNDDWHFHGAMLAAAYTRSLIEVTTPYYLDDVTAAGVIARQSTVKVIDQTMREHHLSDNSAVAQVAEHLMQAERLDSHKEVSGTNAPLPQILHASSSEAFKQLPPLFDKVQVLDIASLGSTLSDYRMSVSSKHPRLEGVAADQPDEVVTDPVHDSDYTDLLIAHSRRLFDDIELELKKWEFQRAFILAAELERWLAAHDKDTPGKVIREGYYRLARVATIQAKQSADDNGSPDFARARSYLSKAKNAQD